MWVWSAFDRSQKSTVEHHDGADHAQLHHLGKSWDGEGFRSLLQGLQQHPGELILQYRPTAFSGSARTQLRWFLKNLPPQVRLHVILHRSFERPAPSASCSYWLLSPLLQLRMLWHLIRHAQRIYITSTKTLTLWHRLCAVKRTIHHLPVPSHISVVATPEKVRNLRCAFAQKNPFIIGTFSSFTEPEVLGVLRETLAVVLKKHSSWIWLALGRYSRGFVQFMQGSYPHLADRLQYSGELDPLALSAHLQICDVTLQPYHRGVSTLRTSAMAPLCHGLPLITSVGRKTESLWQSTGCARLVRWNHLGGYIHSVEFLARNPEQRKQLAQRGRSVYRRLFSLESNMELLGVPRVVEESGALRGPEAGDQRMGRGVRV